MLGGSWGYGPAGIPYGPSRIWVIGVSPHRTGRWWAGMIHSRTSLLCVGPERLNSLVLRGPWARSGSVFYAFLAHSSTRPKCFMRGGQYTLLRPELLLLGAPVRKYGFSGYPRFWPIERPAHVHPYTPTSRTHYPRIHAPEYTKRGYVRGCVWTGGRDRGAAWVSYAPLSLPTRIQEL